MVAFLVTIESGEPSEGQRPGSGTVIYYLSKPPVAEGRNGNQIWPLAKGTRKYHSAVADVSARQEQRSRGKTVLNLKAVGVVIT